MFTIMCNTLSEFTRYLLFFLLVFVCAIECYCVGSDYCRRVYCEQKEKLR